MTAGLVCAKCEKPMQRRPTSRPQGEAVCADCVRTPRHLIDKAISLYKDGHSQLEVQALTGVTRNVLRRELLACGVEVRTLGEAADLRYSKLTQEQRDAVAAAAHAAVLERHRAASKPPTPLQLRARKLRQSGATYREIGDLLGISIDTARNWTDIDRTRASQRKQDKRRASAVRLLKAKQAQEETDRTIRAAKGSDIGEAYTQLRRTAVRLDRVHASLDVGARRQAIRDALTAIHHAEDHIVRALRTGE